MSATNRGSVRRTGDAYYTPDALARALVATLPIERDACCLEPHVGGGAFARALHAVGAHVIGQDIDPDAAGFADCDHYYAWDFLGAEVPWRLGWIIGNPPFAGFEDHVVRAHGLRPTHGIAFLLRLAVLESAKRLPLWRTHMPDDVWPIAERPSFTGGVTDSCAYGWFVWHTRTQYQAHSGVAHLHRPLSWRGGEG